MVPDRWTRPGFLLIGWTTILAPPLLSRGWTNEALFAVSPHVITPFAFVLLSLWGAAYLAVAGRPRASRALLVVFAAEKLAFAATWFARWWGDIDGLSRVFEQDVLAGLFFVAYGPLDVACAAFFALVAAGPPATGQGTSARPSAPVV